MTHHPATRVVAMGRPDKVAGQPVSPPIELSSTYVTAPLGAAVPIYGRIDNASWLGLETVIAELERAGTGGGCVSFASGMAAVSAVMNQLAYGGLLLMPASVYNTTAELAAAHHDRGRLTVRLLDEVTPQTVQAALAEHVLPSSDPRGLEPTAMVWVESPSNPMLTVTDIAGCAAAATQAGAWLVVDNTFATPLLQQPLTMGADVVVHSVTKYLSGHSDLVLGAVVTNKPELREVFVAHRRLHGAIPGPFEAWLALRGIRTLDVRFERAQANATMLAERAATHPSVTRVRYPGSGAMLSIEVARKGADDEDSLTQAAEDVVNGLQVWTAATSLGGVESLAERRRRHSNEPTVVPVNLIRLSVGIEHVDDLWADLEQALDQLA